MSDGSHLRISDSDREQAADLIRDHYAAGRLDSHELDERLQAVYAAKTESELRPLFADLPKLGKSSGGKRSLALAPVRHSLPARIAEGASPGLGIFAVTNVIWLLTGTDGSWWPKYTLIIVILGIVQALRGDDAEAEPQPRHQQSESDPTA